MQKSDSIGQIAAALAKAQGAMSAAKKDSSNPFFKSKYSDLAAVVEAIKKSLSDNEIAYTQVTDIDEHGVIVETVLMHSSGEWFSGKLRMRAVKDDPQGIGSALTYARRYGLQAAVGIPSDDDDGNAASGKTDTMPANKPLAAPHKPVDGAFAMLADDEQVRIRDLAIEVIALVAANDVHKAQEVIEQAALDADEKVALWSQLDSKVRSAIKKAASTKQLAESAQP